MAVITVRWSDTHCRLRTSRRKRVRVMKKYLAGVLLLLAFIIVSSAPASAHHADLTGETFCLDSGWEVIWTADPSNDRNLVMIEADGWQVSGLWVASTSYFQHTTTHPLDETSATMTVDFWWAWGNPVYPNSLYGPITETTTIERPTECTAHDTTSTSTSSTTSIPGTSSTLVTTTAPTTTAPETTSTSSTSTSSSSTTSTVPDSTSTTGPTTTASTVDTTTTVAPSPTSTGPTPSSTSPVTASSLAPAVRLPATGTSDVLVAWAALLISVGGSAVLIARRP